MSFKAAYIAHMEEQNVEGSNKAASYVRALDLLGPILTRRYKAFSGYSDMWAVQVVGLVHELYDYVIEQQKLGDAGIFCGEVPSSYWRSGFYSAALKSYKEFLILYGYEKRLWKVYSETDLKPEDLAQRLSEQQIDAVEELVSDKDIDFSALDGKEVFRQVKTRVNQNFFRKMILAEYGTECCVTGLNVPCVLRASHIVGWAEDKENRLNPANGLCLSANFDAAFDKFLISFDEGYRLIFSPMLKEFCSKKAFREQFGVFEGKRIAFPKRYRPDQKFLGKHRDKFK